MEMPAAEVDTSVDLVHTLLRQQHPDLASLPLKLVANGWDNAIYRLGEALCIRLPRREVAVQLIENEQRWLPGIATQVDVPIPVPVRVGAPGDGYPWPWSITSWATGEIAIGGVPASVAPALAAFLRQLHVPAPADAPHNPVRGIPLAQRAKVVSQQLDGPLRQIWDEAVAAPQWNEPSVWIHGDLHPANILVHNGQLAAIIDFGDLTAGDPATDLAVAWMLFDAPTRAIFHSAYEPDADTWTRSRGWAVTLGTAFALHSDDAPHMAAIARHTLTQVLLP